MENSFYVTLLESTSTFYFLNDDWVKGENQTEYFTSLCLDLLKKLILLKVKTIL